MSAAAATSLSANCLAIVEAICGQLDNLLGKKTDYIEFQKRFPATQADYEWVNNQMPILLRLLLNSIQWTCEFGCEQEEGDQMVVIWLLVDPKADESLLNTISAIEDLIYKNQ